MKERKSGAGRAGPQARKSRLADEAAVLLRELDADRKLISCNDAWLTFSGRTLEQQLGDHWTAHMHADDRERCERAFDDARGRDTPWMVEYRLRRHDDRFVRVIDSIAPAGVGSVSGALDVSALDAEAAAAGIPDPLTLQEQLHDGDRRKDEFISAIAHELRNPLTPILNALNLLKTPRLPPAEAQLAHAMIERQSNQLLRLLDDLLDVSRGKQGRVLLRKERLDLCQLAHAALENARSTLQDAGHRVAVALPQSPLWVDADSARMTQALTNLVVNAARQTPRGGRIELSARAQGEQAVLELADSGAGIAREILPRIFDPFVQLQPGGSAAGLGLGLALARQLVDLHGGTLTAHSEGTGRGTRFVLRLALKAEPAALQGRADARAGAARRILVVDDNRDAARIMSLLLTTMGHEVRTTYDGYSALEVARTFRPDTVLLDLGLPQLDGCTVGERLRQEPHGRDLLLIALTGWGHDSDRMRTRAAGFDHHLIKPVDTEMLRQLLDGSAQAA